MKRYRGYIIDLDGTLYRGNQVIPEALDFVKRLQKRGVPYLYVTNNSSRLPEQVAEHLSLLGFPATPNQVYTSALATARYLQEELSSPAVYVIGEEGLQKAIEQTDCRLDLESPEAVVVGIDRQFTYEKMKKACLYIRQGARFIGTNPDLVLPTEEGLCPGAGSLLRGIASSTNQEPVIIGKPETIMIQYALTRLGVRAEETLIVGDNLATDIFVGNRMQIDTLLVFTGVTTPAMCQHSKIKSTYQVDSLQSWEI
jgi:4-nitrophenyl phosphatase